MSNCCDENTIIINCGGSSGGGSFTPTGPAGGDLTGSYPDPTVKGLQGNAISDTTPSDGQALVWSETNEQWEPATISGDGDFPPLSVNANEVFIGPDGTSGTPLFRLVELTDIPAALHKYTAIEGNLPAEVTVDMSAAKMYYGVNGEGEDLNFSLNNLQLSSSITVGFYIAAEGNAFTCSFPGDWKWLSTPPVDDEIVLNAQDAFLTLTNLGSGVSAIVLASLHVF